MLFNSAVFLFGFLPVTLAGFYLLGRISRDAALRWLILCSLFFYAWWRPLNVALIAPSILLNFALARLLQRWGESRRSTVVLLFGIAFNICFLGYFKYMNFFREVSNQIFDTDFAMTALILPLGISFITFQKIAFLIDVQAGRVKEFTLQDYWLFVLFFPQLIAGPIVHYREMMPQFQEASCRYDGQDMAVGLTLFFVGLCKKLVLADAIAALVSPVYVSAGRGQTIDLFLSWMAAAGFMLQIYFDFSGYSDMALGLARFFGVRLPMNFNSPLRATSIIDFWLRWHITLTRFLTGYLYNPLAMRLTRRRLAQGKAAFGGRNTTLGAFFVVLCFPTVLTMLVSGFWHGAGWTYIVWGAVHGVLLTVNHGWRLLRPSFWPDNASYTRVMRPVGFVLTFVSVAAAMVIFRAPTLHVAGVLLAGIAGANGATMPIAILDQLGPLTALLRGIGIGGDLGSGTRFVHLSLWTIGLLLLAWLTPNALQILSRFEPALGVKPRPGDTGVFGARLVWQPSFGWALTLAVVAAAGLLSLGQPSEFLYWQF